MTCRLTLAVVSVLAVAMTGPQTVVAQTRASNAGQWTAPRTADGRPDLQGVWANNNITPLQRPTELGVRDSLTNEELARLKANADRLFGQDAGDAAFGDQLFSVAISDTTEFTSSDGGTGNYNQFWLAERDFSNRTSLITDPPNGRIPALTAAAHIRQQDQVAYRRDHPADGPEDRGLGERCVNFGVPKLGAGYNSYRQIVQTPSHVAIYHEMAHDIRLIPLDDRPSVDATVRQWNGIPRGRWEGDTLVIETTNFSPKSRAARSGAAQNLHLVERYTRISPDTLEYVATMTDPTTWTQPWTVSIPLKRSDDAVFEYACHEGNYGMEGILAGHRAEERTDAAEVGHSR